MLPAVVALGLVSAALEGAGIGLMIPMLSIIVGHADADQMGGSPRCSCMQDKGLTRAND